MFLRGKSEEVKEKVLEYKEAYTWKLVKFVEK